MSFLAALRTPVTHLGSYCACPLTDVEGGAGEIARGGGGGLTTLSGRLSLPIVGLAGVLSVVGGRSSEAPLKAVLLGDSAASDAAAEGVAAPDPAAAPAFFLA